MPIIKCKMCGGDVQLAEDKTFGTCEYCGSTMTFPKVSDEQRAAAFNRGNHFRRIGEFDKALAVYERIVAEDDTDAEAHWCCALCRFGIEYVEDPATYEWLPTCHRASFDSFLEDVDYLAAVEHSDGITRRQYQKDAAKIAEVQRDILATSQSAEPYDVFISYKELDADGNRTRDSILAQEIYYRLKEKGWRVFFSRISLEDVPGTQYEPYIFAALNSAKVMIVVGTSAENLNAVWVKNEWSRYLSLMRRDRSKLLIPCYRDMDPYDLPEQLAVLMSYDMGKIGFIQDLIRGVDKVLSAEKPKEAPAPVQERVIVQQSGGGPNVTALLKRGQQALEDHDWQAAETFFDKALDMDAECAEAFFGKALAGSRSRDTQSYINNLCSGSAKVETLTLDRDKAHIEESIAKAAVPGYCDEKELRKLYNFDVSYSAKLRGETTFAQQVKAQFSSDRNLARAFRYAQGETKQKLEALKKELHDRLDKRVKAAEAADKEALEEAKEDYAAKLSTADRKVEEKSGPAKEKREADYVETCDMQAKAQTRMEYRNAETRFKALKGFKDANARAEECGRRANELWAAEKAEEEKAKAAAAKKRKKMIAIVMPIVVVCIAFFVVLTTVIIPNQKLNRAQLLIDAGDYEAAVLLLDGLNDKDSASRLESIKPQYYEALLANAHPGSSVFFGSYEQDNHTTNGKEDIEWLVLAKEDDRILVISWYALDCQQYNTKYTDVTWETCSLRKWLNGTFLNAAFSKAEQAMIPTVTVSADKKPDYSTSPGSSTKDQIFLLSIPEVNQYFSNDAERQCKPTAYAEAHGCYVNSSNGNCWWWLRSPGYDSAARRVNLGGSVTSGGGGVDLGDVAVRPALWINLE